ncbi:MAG: DNA glycosylase [Verrucomicrobiales bacterium]
MFFLEGEDKTEVVASSSIAKEKISPFLIIKPKDKFPSALSRRRPRASTKEGSAALQERSQADFPESLREISCGDFSLLETIGSGQVFHWDSDPDVPGVAYTGCLGETALRLWQPCPERLRFPSVLEREVRHFLRLDASHEDALATFPKHDDVLTETVAACAGLRILRQPLWECLATFITSSMKQVAHIRAISLHLRRHYGRRHVLDGRECWSYPTPEDLARAGEPALRAAGLGYRAGYLHATACRLADGAVSLEDLDSLDDAAARAWLRQFPGVGEKVANCVLLFGCDRLGAFPIDVWIERILRERYFPPTTGHRRAKPLPVKHLQTWAESHFGPAAGYAQQFLFHYARVRSNTPEPGSVGSGPQQN